MPSNRPAADVRLHTAISCAPAARLSIWLLIALSVVVGGCARQRYLERRETPLNPLTRPLKLVSRGGPRPTDRTRLLLRRYDLTERLAKEPGVVLASLQEQIQREPSPDMMYAYAELAYIHGLQLEDEGNPKSALDQFGAAVAHAYLYLFDPSLDNFRNPYDPQFRRACDLYNSSLESAMRLVNKQKRLKPGEMQVIQTGKQQLNLQIAVRGPWTDDDFERLEFANDFEIKNGLTNHHHTYGLGVPMIAVRKKGQESVAVEQYYPPGLSFPTTAFLRVMPDTPQAAAAGVHHCLLELYDPQKSYDIEVANRRVPLETDLSTPLAYFLDDPAFQEKSDATFGLRNPAAAAQKSIKGLYMLEPYDAKRIPVIVVHGLWSNPTTWMEMFNDMRFFPEIRNRYQFWFFQYPTGQPFWLSAVQLREALANSREMLDPQHANPNLDQLVLVGHSMGGLVSKMQTIESGDDFWHILSERPFEELKATAEERSQLAKVLYFHPNPSIKRVVTIGTPHKGSYFADYTTYLSEKLITLPSFMTDLNTKLVRENPDFFRSTDVLKTKTSFDSLSPSCPIFPVMEAAQALPATKFNNIVGVLPKDDFLGRISEKGDGVVPFSSAHRDDVESELVVAADHVNVHRHPLTVLEVRRILIEHLKGLELEVQQAPRGYFAPPPLPTWNNGPAMLGPTSATGSAATLDAAAPATGF